MLPTMRLQKELKDSVEERRRLTEEVLELRAAAEERLMLMERIEHIARVERELEEAPPNWSASGTGGSWAGSEPLEQLLPCASLLDLRAHSQATA